MDFEESIFDFSGIFADKKILDFFCKDNLHFFCVYEKDFAKITLVCANLKYYRLIGRRKGANKIYLDDIYSSDYLYFLHNLFKNDGEKVFLRENSLGEFICVKAFVRENKAYFMGAKISDMQKFVKKSKINENDFILIKSESGKYLLDKNTFDETFSQNTFYKINPVFSENEAKIMIKSICFGKEKYAFCEIRKNILGEIYISDINNLFTFYIRNGVVDYEDVFYLEDPFEAYALRKRVKNIVKGNYVIRFIACHDEKSLSGFLIFISESPAVSDLKKVTTRENHALYLAAMGNTNKYIASVMGISVGTVKKILHDGYQKLGITSRVELIKIYEHRARESEDETMFKV